jgi:hypothetical protein
MFSFFGGGTNVRKSIVSRPGHVYVEKHNHAALCRYLKHFLKDVPELAGYLESLNPEAADFVASLKNGYMLCKLKVYYKFVDGNFLLTVSSFD